MGKWLLGIITLAIVATLATVVWPLNAAKRASNLEATIQEALTANGHNVSVEVNGNVARLSGDVLSEDAKTAAMNFAAGVECVECKSPRTWHEVVADDVNIKLPTASPYSFKAVKTAGGGVTLDGYAGSENERNQIVADANAAFPGGVTNNSLKLADGAPNANWDEVIALNLKDLAKLDDGSYSLEGTLSLLKGKTTDPAVRDAINARAAEIKSLGYNAATNISVPEMAALNIGEVTSQAFCQEIFNDLKGDNKINFIVNRAEIRGAKSFDLLNSLASAAKQCAAFRVAISGHTDSDGDDAYNQLLSEARANNVVAYLVNNGVELNRMTAEGSGENAPLADNATAEGKAQNRRIEFVVTKAE